MNSDAAVHAWQQAIGENAVRADDACLDRYARSSAGRPIRPCAVLYPRDRSQVQDIVRIAGEHGVSVYPISRIV